MKAPSLRDAATRLGERSRTENWTHEEFLTACLQREVAARESHGGEGRIRYGHRGWGAGNGSVELYEYRCPCGNGSIVEEHENIPGFREHDVRIDCDRCRGEWQFASGRGTRNWGLEPIAASASI